MTVVVVTLFLLIVAAGVPVWLLISTGNRVAAMDSRCSKAFADIDVHLKRRADLIPGLVECVKGFAGHEKEILSEVAEARKFTLETTAEDRQRAEAALGRKVGTVFSLAEKYPDLAASSHFRELRAELVNTEERLTAARRFFNLAVEEYNTTLTQFPGSLVAARRGLDKRRLFDLGIDRIILDEPVAFRFTASPSATGA
jgi:LemA protein